MIGKLLQRQSQSWKSSRPDWLKSLVLPAGLAAMETCWIYPWSLVAGQWGQQGLGRPLLSGISIFLLLAAGRASARLLLGRRWPLLRVRVILLALGLVAILLLLRVEYYGQAGLWDVSWFSSLATIFARVVNGPSPLVLAAALGVVLWWRGTSHGRGRIDSETVEGVFKIGVASLVVSVLIVPALGSLSKAFIDSNLAVYVLGFFSSGLVSLSMARLEAIRRQSQSVGDRALDFNRQWLGVLLGIVALLLMLALGFAQLVSLDLVASLGGPVLKLLDLLTTVFLYVVVLPIGFLLEGITFLIRLLFHPGSPQPLPPNDMSFLQRLQQEANGGVNGLPPEIILAAKWIVISLAAALAIFLLSRSIRRWNEREREDEVTEERDSVWTKGTLLQVILSWLRSLSRRLFGKRLVSAPDPAAQQPPVATGPETALTIRRIYRDLLRLGTSIGLRRRRGETPYEHLPRLQSELSPPADVAALTEIYVKARYSPGEPEEEETGEAGRRWENILANFQRTRKAGE